MPTNVADALRLVLEAGIALEQIWMLLRAMLERLYDRGLGEEEVEPGELEAELQVQAVLALDRGEGGHHNETVRPKDAARFAEERLRIGDVLEKVVGEDDVEARRGKR